MMIASVAFAGRDIDEEGQGDSQELQRMQSAFVPIPQEQKPEPKANLSGAVTDENGNPLRGVEVQCIDSDGNVVAQGITDDGGNYLFEGLPEGTYTIRASYSGYEWKKIEFEGAFEPPSMPKGLVLYEIEGDSSGEAMLRAQWDHVSGATYYRCELLKPDSGFPIRQYPDMMQNFCEFGGLEADTYYEVRVYAKNDAGYSEEPAKARSRTSGRRPQPPFGLGVTHAKNNVVELVWDHADIEDLEGFLVQVRKEGGKYRYYSKDGFTSKSSEAYVVQGSADGFITFRIDDRLENGVPFLENTVPYSFRVMARDMRDNLSEASHAVTGIVLEDTIPPKSPTNLQYEFVEEGLLRLTWETEDIDVNRYRIYYGAHEDRWDAVSYTSRRFYDVRIDRSSFPQGEIYVRIVAIDRAGNESGYQPLQRSAILGAGDDKTENITLSSDLGYKDRSIAIREVISTPKVRKKIKKKPVQPKAYTYEGLSRKGFIVEKGETATLRGEIEIPPSTTVVVKSGAMLILDGAVLSPSHESWGGIRFHEGSRGSIKNTRITGADVGIGIHGSDGLVTVRGLTVEQCRDYGLYIKNSRVTLENVAADRNGIGVYTKDSEVSISKGVFKNNERGIHADNYSITVEESIFSNNRIYGIRLYGGGTLHRNEFRGNYVAIVFERGRGSATATDNVIEYSSIDGVVVSSSNVTIERNVIARNENHGIYIKNNANPTISENDIVENGRFAVTGGGMVAHCYIARNNGSIYIDDTEQRGIPDNVFNSSSTGVIKQIYRVDFIDALSYTPVVARNS
jgi:parallel beta-helix repeat protein